MRAWVSIVRGLQGSGLGARRGERQRETVRFLHRNDLLDEGPSAARTVPVLVEPNRLAPCRAAAEREQGYLAPVNNARVSRVIQQAVPVEQRNEMTDLIRSSSFSNSLAVWKRSWGRLASILSTALSKKPLIPI